MKAEDLQSILNLKKKQEGLIDPEFGARHRAFDIPNFDEVSLNALEHCVYGTKVSSISSYAEREIYFPDFFDEVSTADFSWTDTMSFNRKGKPIRPCRSGFLKETVSSCHHLPSAALCM